MKRFEKYYLRVTSKVLIICLAGLLFSCNKDWLEKKPDIKTTIPATLKDCQLMLDYEDLFNTNCPGYGEVASDGHYVSSSSGMDESDINAYTWSNNPATSSSKDWANGNAYGSYGKIFTCNLILETLEKINVTNNNEANYIKGQALFLRAKTFYELAQVFVPPYERNGSNSGLGLPLRLESDINIPSVRSSVQQTYDCIIKDLVEAQDLLPEITVYKTRASKAAVLALLARIYNGMEEYEKSGIYADDALKLYNTLLDYSKLSTTSTTPAPKLNDEVIFHSVLVATSGNVYNARVDPELKAMYVADDLRNTIFFTISGGQISFKGHYGGRICFNGLATDELYLIRAESYAREGKIIEAMNDINTLLTTRWKKVNGVSTYINQIASGSEEALKIIIDERKKQLLFRGLRWTDLRRLNLDPRFAVTLTRVFNGKSYTLEPNSYKYTFPLPLNVIQMTDMPQNTGW